MTSPELQQGLQIAGKVQLTATATATDATLTATATAIAAAARSQAEPKTITKKVSREPF